MAEGDEVADSFTSIDEIQKLGVNVADSGKLKAAGLEGQRLESTWTAPAHSRDSVGQVRRIPRTQAPIGGGTERPGRPPAAGGRRATPRWRGRDGPKARPRSTALRPIANHAPPYAGGAPGPGGGGQPGCCAMSAAGGGGEEEEGEVGGEAPAE